jgi:hypothetical protein
MNTISFAQAQFTYENMLPEDDDCEIDASSDFKDRFFAGQLVMTPEGTGIVTGKHTGELGVDCDGDTGEVWSVASLATIEVAIPNWGREFYPLADIQVREGDKWVEV